MSTLLKTLKRLTLSVALLLLALLAACAQTPVTEDRTGDWFVPADIIQINLERQVNNESNVYCVYLETEEFQEICRALSDLPRSGGESAEIPDQYALRVLMWGKNRENLDLYLDDSGIIVSKADKTYIHVNTTEAAGALKTLNQFYQKSITDNEHEELPVVSGQPTRYTIY